MKIRTTSKINWLRFGSIIKGILMVVFVVTTQLSLAQNNCSNSLLTAAKEYEAGNFNSCIDLLNPCIKNLKSNEVFQAYRLLGLCYLNLKDDENANRASVNLLRSKSNYRDFPYFDPTEFTRLLAKYYVWPKVKIGYFAGFNVNSVRPISNYSLTGSEATFLSKAGYQIGMLGEYFIRKDFSIVLNGSIEGLGYERTAYNVSNWRQTFSESLIYLSVPITAKKYVYQTKNVRIAAELGIQTQFLLSTTSNIELKHPVNNNLLQASTNQKLQRNNTLFYLLPGIDAQYKLTNGAVFCNVRYGIGLSNVINADRRFDDLEFAMQYQYIDSDIAFNPFYVTFGYQLPLKKFVAVKLKP